MKLQFQNLEFEEVTIDSNYASQKSEADAHDSIKVKFLKYFYFFIPRQKLKKICSDFKVGKNFIEFCVQTSTQNSREDTHLQESSQQERISSDFNALLSQGFLDLKGFFGRRAVYVHKNSNIPLIGNLAFGIIDRNSNALELKPITNCNLDCVFCSVDEGKSSKKAVDFVVESDYLIQETKKLLEFKAEKTSLHINPHGEPLLYADLVNLVKGLSQLKYAGLIVIYTNGALLNEKLIDELIDAGLGRISVSLHTLSPAKAAALAGTNYDVVHVKKMIEYAKDKGLQVIISPVYIKGNNETDVEDIIIYGKEKNIQVTIQNFLNYQLGRNPAKQLKFDKFFERLKDLEKKHKVNLLVNEDPNFLIKKTKHLPCPFKTKEIICAHIVSCGRNKNERIAAAKNRSITLPFCDLDIGCEVNVMIEKSKDNIFIGTIADKKASPNSYKNSHQKSYKKSYKKSHQKLNEKSNARLKAKNK